MSNPDDLRLAKLQESVSISKLGIENLEEAIKKLQHAIAAPFVEGKISWTEYNDLNAPATLAVQLIREGSLGEKLDMLLQHASMREGTPLLAISDMLSEYTDILEILKQLGVPLNTLFEKPLPIVAVREPSSGEVRTSKTIDNLLYSFTPYKLRGVAGSFSILLPHSIRGDTIQQSWYGGEIYSYDSAGMRVITPDEIRPIQVRDLKNPVEVKGEYPFKLELDRSIPEHAYYCLQGYYLSYKEHCQYRGCPLWGPCGGVKYWRGPKPYQAIARISPDVKVVVDEYEFLSKLLETDKDELRLERIEELTGKIFIESVVFLSPKMLTTPMIRPKETIGYRVKTKAIALSFREDWVAGTVTGLLQANPEAFNWMYLKWYVTNNFDPNDVRGGLTPFFWNLIQHNGDDRHVAEFEKGLKARKTTSELVAFTSRTLMHSLAHLLHEELTLRLQTDGGNLIYFFSGEPDKKDGRYRIFLFENAEKGLGLTESFARRAVETGNGLFKEIMENILEEQKLCLDSQLQIPKIDPSDEDVKRIRERLDLYKGSLEDMQLFAPVELVRYILASVDPVTKDIVNKPEFTTYVDDLLSLYPSCWDGCYNCVRLETDCHETPYEQMYSVSKVILIASLNKWMGQLGYIAAQPLKLKLGEASDIFNLVKGTKRSIKIITPWISKEIAEILVQMAKSSGISVELLTSDDKQVKTHTKALEILRTNTLPNVAVRVLLERRLHAKMLIIDQEMLVMGSANLTLSGMFENVENFVEITDKQTIGKSQLQFDDLWGQSTPLK